jgi:hypothetical protein
VYANSDDPTILNDAILSAVLGAPRFLGSQARFEAPSAYHGQSTVAWDRRPESRQWIADVEEATRRSRTLRFAHGDEKARVRAFPIRADPNVAVCVAPRWLLSHAMRESHYITHLAGMRGTSAKLSAL